jgi:hypothetical protein
VPNSRGDRPGTGVNAYNTGHNQGPAERVPVSEIEADLLRTAIDAILAAGDAIQFARTMDGGCLAVQVLSDGIVAKFYWSGLGEISTGLEMLVDTAISRV